MVRRITAAALVPLLLAGCREEDGFIGGPDGARAYVTSDPPGGEIFVDGKVTGQFTPDTIRGLTGRHDLTVRLDTLDTSYRFTAGLTLTNPDTIARVAGPLVFRCSTENCRRDLFRHYGANRLRFANNPVGTFFMADGTGQGILWPSETNNSYASGGIPMFSGVMRRRGVPDTVALGMYDTQYLGGRPVPVIVKDADRVWLRQTTWIIPPAHLLGREPGTVRGIRIEQSLLSTLVADDIAVLRLVFHNITNDPLYRLVDPFVPPEGATFESAYIGFALDADIGIPTDDQLSYDPDLNLAMVYDAQFREDDFTGGFRFAPGLVGLRMLEAPPATSIILNGWGRARFGDWFAGTPSEPDGWGMMSRRRTYPPFHLTHPRIGHMPPDPSDMRVMVSAGPLTLAPGDSAAITVAIVLAQPAEGTFVSGTAVAPGNPIDVNRALYRIASGLFERARAAESVATQIPPR